MKVKDLQTATKLLAEIHEIDQQIIALEKKGIEVINEKEFKNIEIVFEVPEPEKSIHDNASNFENEILRAYNIPILKMGFMGGRFTSEKNKEKLNFKLSDYEVLAVIELLIRIKKDHRAELCKKIYALGVNV